MPSLWPSIAATHGSFWVIQWAASAPRAPATTRAYRAKASMVDRDAQPRGGERRLRDLEILVGVLGDHEPGRSHDAENIPLYRIWNNLLDLRARGPSKYERGGPLSHLKGDLGPKCDNKVGDIIGPVTNASASR